MPKYTLVRLVDAYVRYEATVEADTPEQAAELADDDATRWQEEDVTEFQHTLLGVMPADFEERERLIAAQDHEWLIEPGEE